MCVCSISHRALGIIICGQKACNAGMHLKCWTSLHAYSFLNRLKRADASALHTPCIFSSSSTVGPDWQSKRKSRSLAYLPVSEESPLHLFLLKAPAAALVVLT